MTDSKLISVIDDAVQCYFYSNNSCTDEGYWKNMQNSINQYIERLSENYIWHKDKFQVYFPIPSLNSDHDALPEHLHSITQFGDNIEDEWYIIYLVLKITKRFEELVVQVNDNDGEFLLIEAADKLPSWINPDNTENRVYIQNGHIHIIPPKIIRTDKEFCTQDALKAIVQFPNETKSNADIHNAIAERIRKYPENYDIHRTVIELPLPIATILNIKPSLISVITDAYCNKDMIDSRILKTVNYKEQKVSTTVKFTKCLYAMLTHTKPMKNFVNYNKQVDLGMKLTAGYHIVMGKSTDVFLSKQWNKFLKSLNDIGYFKGNLEGSKDYVQLLNTAKEYYLTNECSITTNVANDIKEAMESDAYRKQYELLKNNQVELINDNDDWLNIHPSQLDDLLRSRYGKQAEFEDKGLTPQTLTNQLNTFLKESSDFEGIETEASEDKEINFDADAFGDALKDILDQILLESSGNMEVIDEISESDDDDDNYLDSELKQSLKGFNNFSNVPKDTLTNLTQSVKEEGSHSGPSSILLKQIGISKMEILDSDDDEIGE